MSAHPVNLGLRFLLELAMLAALGYWAWDYFDGPVRFLLAVALPVIAAAAWGVFKVPDDASNSGKAPVPIPGTLRLALELALFGLAALGLYFSGVETLALIFAGVTVVHYLASYDRILWLVRQ